MMNRTVMAPFRKRQAVSVSGFIVAWLFVSSFASAAGHLLEFPTGVLNPGSVPLGLLEKIATAKVTDISGKTVVAGKPLPYCNLAGDIVAYAFPFCVDCPRFPGYGQVFQELEDARRVFEQSVSGGKSGGDPEPWPPYVRSESGSGQSYAGRSRPRKGERELWGIGRYWTVIVMASEDEYPIMEISEGLPQYFTVGELAREKARQALGSPVVRLNRIFCASPLDQLFEFASGGQVILVHSFSLKDYAPGLLRETRAKNKTEETKLVIRQAWDDLKRAAGK